MPILCLKSTKPTTATTAPKRLMNVATNYINSLKKPIQYKNYTLITSNYINESIPRVFWICFSLLQLGVQIYQSNRSYGSHSQMSRKKIRLQKVWLDVYLVTGHFSLRIRSVRPVRKGITPSLESYEMGMGLEASILFDWNGFGFLGSGT